MLYCYWGLVFHTVDIFSHLLIFVHHKPDNVSILFEYLEKMLCQEWTVDSENFLLLMHHSLVDIRNEYTWLLGWILLFHIQDILLAP